MTTGLMGGARAVAPALPGGLHEWVESLTGPCTVEAGAGIAPGRHDVRRVTSDTGAWVLKLHRDQRSWNAEVFAYRQWCGAAQGSFARLTGASQEHRAILTSYIAGRPLEEARLPERLVLEAWREAGRIAALVHGQAAGERFGPPWEAPLQDPVAYIRRSLDSAAGRARRAGLLQEADERLVWWAEENCDVFRGEVARPVNPDYTPGNWLVDGGGRFLGAVDLEEMRWGVRVEAFSHLWAKFTPDWPDREAAFFDGYGMNPHRALPQQVRHICVRTALTNLILGRERNDARYAARGRGLLARLARE